MTAMLGLSRVQPNESIQSLYVGNGTISTLAEPLTTKQSIDVASQRVLHFSFCESIEAVLHYINWMYFGAKAIKMHQGQSFELPGVSPESLDDPAALYRLMTNKKHPTAKLGLPDALTELHKLCGITTNYESELSSAWAIRNVLAHHNGITQLAHCEESQRHMTLRLRRARLATVSEFATEPVRIGSMVEPNQQIQLQFGLPVESRFQALQRVEITVEMINDLSWTIIQTTESWHKQFERLVSKPS
jgi:hypothetical protein